MAGFPAPFPLAPLDPAWGLPLQGTNPFDAQPLLQFNNSLKDGGDDNIDDVDVDGLHDAANFILGNTLQYTPHNFHRPIIIHYPTTIGCFDSTSASKKNKRNNDSAISLPVCFKCKKNSKTRDICRVKLGHTSVPWTPTYICMSIDDSCINSDGTYVVGNDMKLHAVVLSSPIMQSDKESKAKYVVQTSLDAKAPVCWKCKHANRTRAYCRKQHCHKELPWNTLFVMLKLQQKHGAVSSSTINTDGGGSAVHQESSEKVYVETDKESKQPSNEQQELRLRKTDGDTDLEEEFDINCIAPSRTFLSIISSTENSIRWLKCVNMENADIEANNFTSSNNNYFPSLNVGDASFQTRQNKSNSKGTKKKKSKTIECSTKSTSKRKSKRSKPANHKGKQKLDNAQLALEAIEHAKREARKEQDAARLMGQHLRFPQQPPLLQLEQQKQQLLLQQQQQQQQQQQLILQQQQQQALYQLQESVANESANSCVNDRPYDEDKLLATDNLEKMNDDEDDEVKMSSILNGEDILDEAAKLAEWL